MRVKTKIDRITLAHISDVHLAPVTGLSLRHWNLKRLFGSANWFGARSKIHQRGVVDMLSDDMMAHNPDHIVVTGDLVNLGLPKEIEAATGWLSSLGPADSVSVIPGNHDIYVEMGSDIGVARWAEHMASNPAGAMLLSKAGALNAANAYVTHGVCYPAGGGRSQYHDRETTPGASFPYCRIIGPVALIGLNSAVPTPLFNASGNLGAHQRRLLTAILDEAGRQGLVRVVLIHHPPVPGQTPARRALVDACEMEEVLKTHGAELVLHGHNHTDTTKWFNGPLNAAPIVGVASGSASIAHGDEPLARYNIIRIISWDNNVRIEITGRGARKPGEPIADICLQSFQMRLA